MNVKKVIRYTGSVIMLVFMIAFMVISITSCNAIVGFVGDFIADRIDYSYKYDEEWIMGKTIEEVAEEYGEFDAFTPNYSFPAHPNGSMGFYLTKKGSGDGIQDRYLQIYFDGDGIAWKVIKNYATPGG